MKTIFLLFFSTVCLVSFSQDYNFKKDILLIGIDSEEELLKYVPHPNGCVGTYIIKPLSIENSQEHGFRVIHHDSYIVKSINSEEVIPFSVFYNYFMKLSKKTNRVLFQGLPNQEIIFVKKEGDEFIFYPTDPYFWTI